MKTANQTAHRGSLLVSSFSRHSLRIDTSHPYIPTLSYFCTSFIPKIRGHGFSGFESHCRHSPSIYFLLINLTYIHTMKTFFHLRPPVHLMKNMIVCFFIFIGFCNGLSAQNLSMGDFLMADSAERRMSRHRLLPVMEWWSLPL